MIIHSIKLLNFQLFKEVSINFSKLNLITGANADDISLSGNGSGKTTILNAILFNLYGSITNLNLTDLVRIGTKTCSVELDFEHNNEQYRIVRTIPTSLKIYKNNEELQFNTATIAQKYIDNLTGDNNKFRTYNMIDNQKGINLLDLGIISLRKTLVDFVNGQFVEIRNNLLAKKNDREKFSRDKRYYTYYLSEKKLDILEKGLLRLTEEYRQSDKEAKEQYNVIGNYKSEIQSREKLIYYKEQDKKKLNNGYCPILNTKCSILQSKQKEVELAKADEIKLLAQEISEIKNLVQTEESAYRHYLDIVNQLNNKSLKTNEYISKLKEAFKFSEYKYTKADIQLYTDTIKTLDNFIAYYVQEWLTNLSIILNDLLKEINISVIFNTEKSFITVNNNGQELKYEQLSSGQKVFLNAIFKLGILLNEGITEGLILIDEGINTLDEINLFKFIEILKNLNFQTVLIYQNINKELKEVNYINVIRKEGETKLND
jgi:DNA repair exonuclease SbcCD ATPase subunit